MFNRRAFLSHSAAAGAALSAGLGVRAAPSNAQTTTLTLAVAARSPNGLNPQQPSQAGSDSWGMYQIFNTLVAAPLGRWAVRPEEFRPSLAESWEASPDKRTWTYRLRKGVRFHKGYGELTADDVVFTFRRQLDPAIVTYNKILYTNIVSVDAIDPLTVRFALKRPDPTFNGACIAQLSANILCRKAFEEKGENYSNDPIGTGPYQLQSIDRTRGIVLAAFPEHFAGPPASPAIHISFIADTTARTLAFASGQIDMIEGARAPGWIQTMRQRSVETIFDMTAPGSFIELNVNLTRKPLDDLKVRQAIRYAINNKAIATAFGGMATPMIGTIAPHFAGSVTREELPPELQYNYDPKKAKALLAEAGHPDGVSIPCYVSQREDYASIMLMIQEQLRAAGINLDMRIIDHSTFHAENRKDKNTLSLYASSFPPVPHFSILRQLSASAVVKADGTGQENLSHYGVAIPGIDALMEKAELEPDFDKRVLVVKDMEKKILADLPLLGIVTLSYVIARNPRVDLGFKIEAGPAYWSLAKAKRIA